MSGEEMGQSATPVTFLAYEVYGGGGIARTVVALANRLSGRHKVRVISLFQTREEPRYPLHPDVELVVLRDLTTAPRPLTRRVRRALKAQPTRLRPTPPDRGMSLLTDLLLRRALRSVRDGVIVSTRPSLHLASLTFGREDVVKVGWDHSNFLDRTSSTKHRPVIDAAVPRLDGWVVLTQADAEDYRGRYTGAATEIEPIPNAIPWPLDGRVSEPARSRVIVSIGRYVYHKRLSRLIRIFEPLAGQHPDWQLHLYGWGDQERSLRRLISKLALGHQVKVLGFISDVPEVLTGAAIFAMTSEREGFPMSLLEAMSHGVPMISYDCPRGPGEIIRDGENGLLIVDPGIESYRHALAVLIADGSLRARMGTAGQRIAREYDVEVIGQRWSAYLDQLVRSRPSVGASWPALAMTRMG
jgi:glycosyltransferase involved in cell wall biosynthesis